MRDKSHWNASNIKPVDPVTLGLCSQIELDEVIAKAADKRRKMDAEKAARSEGPGLAPAQDTPAFEPEPEPENAYKKSISADDVFRDFE